VNLPFAESSEQNKSVIFDAIKSFLQGDVLEIGSGTGQHAVFFAGQLPQLNWQTSEVESNLPGIEAWIRHSELTNLLPPIALDVLGRWPERQFDTVYSANCFHIMGEAAVAKCFEGVGACLKEDGFLAVYGPFNYAGNFTSESNARFDAMLKARDPESGIKDFEWLDQIAAKQNLRLLEDIAMPENNRSLIWQKRT
jgi:cyclopropane fatty-acyl-phospholipid synthase-like methyltransferase